MRRSFEEFTAEVYRRRDNIKKKRKQKTVFLTYFAPIAICFVLSFSMLTVIMPILLSGNNMAPDSEGDSVMDNGDINNKPNYDTEGDSGYLLEISYVTVYGDGGRTVYNNADDIWEVFLYVEDYPEDFKHYKGNPSTDGADYKVMVCLRDGTTHYYLLDRLSDEEVRVGFQLLMERLNSH